MVSFKGNGDSYLMEFKETLYQSQVCDYNVYLQLKQLNYTDHDIAQHMNISLDQLHSTVQQFT